MKTAISSLILLTIIFFCSGCDLFQQRESVGSLPDFKTKKDIEDSIVKIEINTKTIKEKTENISTEAQKIYNDTIRVESGLSEEFQNKMGVYLVDVKNSSQTIIEDSKEIIRANMDLATIKTILENAADKVETTDELLKTLVKERDNLTIALKKAEEARDSALHKTIRWLILASIIGAGALGVFGFMYGSKLCLTLSAVCIVVMSIAIFVETYFIYIVILGGVILLGLVGALVWNIVIQKKAFKEVVDTVEVAQDNMPKEAVDKIFGKNGQTGVMDTIQSKSTMDLVKKEKNNMPSLWSYAKVKNGSSPEKEPV